MVKSEVTGCTEARSAVLSSEPGGVREAAFLWAVPLDEDRQWNPTVAVIGDDGSEADAMESCDADCPTYTQRQALTHDQTPS